MKYLSDLQNTLPKHTIVFEPDFTPAELLEKGVFGGSYWRPIYSSVLQKNYQNDYTQYEWAKYIPLYKLTNKTPVAAINYYKVHCGTTLEAWEEKGWIKPIDPRGWFQWYCRYYTGRRTDDDIRQIKRWYSIKQRFYSKHKVLSPRVKQTLLHWAINPEPK